MGFVFLRCRESVFPEGTESGSEKKGSLGKGVFSEK